MDVALTIFRIGVGVGVLLVGLGVILAVLALRPVVRDLRSLAGDVRRLSRLAEEEMPALLERQGDAEKAGGARPPGPTATPWAATNQDPDGDAGPGRAPVGPVQSADAREDERIA